MLIIVSFDVAPQRQSDRVFWASSTYFAYGTPPVEITADAQTDLLKHAAAAVLVS